MRAPANFESDSATVVYDARREAATVVLVGEFDVANLEVLVDAVRTGAALSDRVVVDLERVTFLGIRSLTCMLDAAHEGAAQIVVRNPSRTTERLLRLVLDGERSTVVVEPAVPGAPV
jgi:anti-anti-sigma regulatory factor